MSVGEGGVECLQGVHFFCIRKLRILCPPAPKIFFLSLPSNDSDDDDSSGDNNGDNDYRDDNNDESDDVQCAGEQVQLQGGESNLSKSTFDTFLTAPPWSCW